MFSAEVTVGFVEAYGGREDGLAQSLGVTFSTVKLPNNAFAGDTLDGQT